MLQQKTETEKSGKFSPNKNSLIKLVFILLFLFVFRSGISQIKPSNQDSLIITSTTLLPFKIDREEPILFSSFRIVSPIHSNLSIEYNQKEQMISILNIEDHFKNYPSDTIIIKYRFFPFKIQKQYKRFSLSERIDSSGNKVQQVEQKAVTSIDDVFRDTNLRKSGSFVRGITVGSNRDLTLNSGFRMQMDGNLTDDVEVSAVLTDENIPIQPEGNTQTLQEFDKVFIQIRSPSYSVTLGDYNLDFSGTQFSDYHRKLQGFEVTANFPKVQGLFSFANSRGKFNSNSFTGIDGNQGPYRLRGKYNEKFIVVLAGTERVYLNGSLLTRGETNDYTIEYGSGEVIFTPNILITSASRITIDFEYSDRLFARDFIASEVSTQLWNNKIQTQVSYVREADNPDAPIDITLSDSDKTIIKNAGSKIQNAFRSGVVFVGHDSTTGKPLGSYVQRDTTIFVSGISKTIKYYIYDPGNNLAVYRISFSEVEPGKGNYSRISFGYYEFQTGGNYEPISYLPIPSSAQILDFKTTFNLSKNWSFQNEIAASDNDVNLFSDADNYNRNDIAFTNSIKFKSDSLLSNSMNWGTIETSVFQKYQGERFNFIDRDQVVDFNRIWALDRTESGIERQLEWTSLYKFSKPFQIGTSIGILNQGNFQESKKYELTSLEQIPEWIQFSYKLTQSQSENKNSNTESDWNQQVGNVNYTISQFTPLINFLHEKRTLSSTENDSLQLNSFEANEIEAGLDQQNPIFRTSFRSKQRREQDVAAGQFFHSNDAYTQSILFHLNEFYDFETDLNVTNFQKKYTETARLKGNSNSEALLIKWTTKYSPMKNSIESETDYSVNTQKTSRLDKIYIKVLKGSGNYIWVDRNQNGIEENDEFESTRFDDGEYVLRTFPSDNLIPIIDLRTSWRFKLKPYRSDEFNFLGDFIKSKFSTETYIAIDEKSQSSKLSDIYLLNFSSFLNDSTTISGNQQWIQDLFYDELNRNFNLRIRYSQRKSLIQYSLDIEKRFVTERSIRMNLKIIENLFNQTDFGYGENQFQTTSIVRPKFLIQNWFIIPDLSFRNSFVWEIGLKSFLDSRTNKLSDSQKAVVWTEIFRYSYSFQNKGRFHSEIEMTRTSVSKKDNEYIPYELTNGNPEGRLYVWRSSFDYRLSDFITSFVSYDGRLSNNNPAIHTFRAEIRAFF